MNDNMGAYLSKAGVSNSNSFKGHILTKNALAGRIKPKKCVQGPHFSKIVHGHFLILVYVTGRTDLKGTSINDVTYVSGGVLLILRHSTEALVLKKA
jgi:hypothetical protein